jgi:hypothetical protein
MKKAIPLNLLLDHTNHQTLSVWIKLVTIYQKPIFYNFNYQKLSDLTGISHTTLRKHIAKMIELEWCYIRDKNLCFKSINKLKGKERVCCLIPVMSNKTEQIKKFRGACVVRNILTQRKAIKRKGETVTMASTKPTKSIIRKMREAGGADKYLLQLRKSFNKNTILSNKKFGALFGLSKWSGVKIQKALNLDNQIKSSSNLEVVMKNASRIDYLRILNANYGYACIYNETTRTVSRRLANKVDAIVCSNNL